MSLLTPALLGSWLQQATVLAIPETSEDLGESSRPWSVVLRGQDPSTGTEIPADRARGPGVGLWCPWTLSEQPVQMQSRTPAVYSLMSVRLPCK